MVQSGFYQNIKKTKKNTAVVFPVSSCETYARRRRVAFYKLLKLSFGPSVHNGCTSRAVSRPREPLGGVWYSRQTPLAGLTTSARRREAKCPPYSSQHSRRGETLGWPNSSSDAYGLQVKKMYNPTEHGLAGDYSIPHWNINM